MGDLWPRSADRLPLLILDLLQALPDIRTKPKGTEMKTFLETAEIPKSTVWKTSTRSGAAGHCVQVAPINNSGVLLRHSKAPDVGAFVFSPDEWSAFVGGVKDGDFDHLLA